MRRSDLSAVARDAYESNQSLLPSLKRSFDNAARAQRHIPLNRVGEVVELPEVNVVDSEAVEGAFELLSRRAGSTLARLGREEKK